MTATLEHRLMIYVPLALLCALASAWLGVAAGVWSFVQILAVIELTYRLGMPVSAAADGAEHA